MTARPHLLWVQELLASRGIDVLVDFDATTGTTSFTRSGRTHVLPITDLPVRSVVELADAIQASLTS